LCKFLDLSTVFYVEISKTILILLNALYLKLESKIYPYSSRGEKANFKILTFNNCKNLSCK